MTLPTDSAIRCSPAWSRLRLCVLVALLALMLAGIGAPLHGDHQWRQSHYVSNVEHFLLRGISLSPQTWNLDQPAHMYDFPVYQYMATVACRLTGLGPIVVCRAISILLFGLSYVVLGRILTSLRLAQEHTTFAVLMFATSPLVVHYFQAPLADDLAIFLSLCSLAAFLVWREGRSRWALLLALAAGFLSTLIKAPIHFPAFVAMASVTLEGRLRNLWRPGFVLHVGVLALALLLFLTISRVVNGEARASGTDLRWYMGTLGDRVDAGLWLHLLRDVAMELLNPVVVVLVVLGVPGVMRRCDLTCRRLVLGWSVGVMASVVVLLPVTAMHNYYLMPLVFPLVILAGGGCVSALRFLYRRCEVIGRLAPPLALVAGSVVPSVPAYWRLATFQPPEYRIGTGRWLRAHSRPDDFVFYLYWKEGNHWDPQYLFYAKRMGYNLRLARLRVSDLGAIIEKHGAGFDRFLIFAEAHLHERVGPRLAALHGCSLLVSGERGRVYEYRPE